jgi:hypothetical protein
VPARRIADPQRLVTEQRKLTALRRVTLLHEMGTSLWIPLRNGSCDRSRVGSGADQECEI